MKDPAIAFHAMLLAASRDDHDSAGKVAAHLQPTAKDHAERVAKFAEKGDTAGAEAYLATVPKHMLGDVADLLEKP